MADTYEAKPVVFGKFRCKSELDFWITLTFVRDHATPGVPLTGLFRELMESALRDHGSPNKQALIAGKEIDKIWVELDRNMKHMCLMVDGYPYPFSIKTIVGYKPDIEHIIMRKKMLRDCGIKPYEIIA